MSAIKLTIDDTEVTVPEGTTVLDAAQQAGIYIPHLCSHPDLPSSRESKAAESVYRGNELIRGVDSNKEFEGCKLCVVEVAGTEDLPTACTTQVKEGMVIHTNTTPVKELRQRNLSLILANHPHTCLTCAQREGCAREPCSMKTDYVLRCCPKFGRCELQKVAEHIGVSKETPRYTFANIPVIEDEPLLVRNYNLCIGCTRCVRVCKEVRGVGALGFVFDSNGKVTVGTVAPTLKESGCKFCTACVEVCPTGALTDKKSFKEPQKEEVLIPCKAACPAGINVPQYVRLTAQQKFGDALAVVRENLPLPSVCSYVCLRFCEAKCRRGEVNEPVAIRALKRFVSQNHSELWKKGLQTPKPSGKRVAIVGSGPAGLTAGYYLARQGHEVTIFEQSSTPGGMLRDAISKKRLPKEAIKRDIDAILQMGVKLQLNTSKTSVDELLEEGFNAVFLAMGSTYVGAPALRLEGNGIKVTQWGSIAVNPETLATSREGVFAGGDMVLGGISEDFIRYATEQQNKASQKEEPRFIDILIDQIALHRGEASRSVLRAVAAGRQAAISIDKYLGGEGKIDEKLVETEKPSPWLGRDEGFADLRCLAEPYRPPPPQFAGLERIEPPLSEKAAVAEAKRCLQCDLRLQILAPALPPEKKAVLEFNAENVSTVPEDEGVIQLLDGEKQIIYIAGTMNLRKSLDELVSSEELGMSKVRYFMYEENDMYTGRESELIQQFMQAHGGLPELNDEMLF